jgi:hypothetical protein
LLCFDRNLLHLRGSCCSGHGSGLLLRLDLLLHLSLLLCLCLWLLSLCLGLLLCKHQLGTLLQESHVICRCERDHRLPVAALCWACLQVHLLCCAVGSCNLGQVYLRSWLQALGCQAPWEHHHSILPQNSKLITGGGWGLERRGQ